MERNHSIDLIKFFACIAVVCIHTKPFYGMGELHWLYFLIDTCARFAVPFFFLTAGYLLGGKKTRQAMHIKHYGVKIVKLYATWYLAFFLFDFVRLVSEAVLQGGQVGTVIRFYLLNQINPVIFYNGMGYSANHVWFLVALIWSVFVLYLFVRINKVHLLLGVAFVFHLIGLFGQSYSGIFEIPFQTANAWFWGIFYVTWGYVLAMHEATIKEKITKVPRFTFLVGFFLFMGLQFIERYITFFRLGGNGGNYFVMTIFMTFCLWCVAICYSVSPSVLTRVGAKSVGIYVVHPMIIATIYFILHYSGMDDVRNTILFQLLFTPSVVLLSYWAYEGMKGKRRARLRLWERKGRFA